MNRYNRPTYRPRSVRRLENKAKKNFIYSIIIGIVILYVGINWGLPFLIGSLSVFNKGRGQQAVKSVTEDPAIAPPVLNIPFEATNTQTIKITGYAAANSKIEIYVDNDLKATENTNSDGSFTVENVPLSLGNNSISGKTINEEGNASLPSKAINVVYNNTKPKLEVSEPSDGQNITGGDKKVKVSGKTDPDSNITINGTSVIIDAEGNFSTTVSLNDGENQISIVASNRFGSTTESSRKVTYTP